MKQFTANSARVDVRIRLQKHPWSDDNDRCDVFLSRRALRTLVQDLFEIKEMVIDD